MKLFMSERRYRENIEMAIQNRERQDDVWKLKSQVEELQYKVQGLENRVHDLEQINWRKITLTPTWSDKTGVEVQKTDITCKGE